MRRRHPDDAGCHEDLRRESAGETEINMRGGVGLTCALGGVLAEKGCAGVAPGAVCWAAQREAGGGARLGGAAAGGARQGAGPYCMGRYLAGVKEGSGRDKPLPGRRGGATCSPGLMRGG